VRWRDTTVKKLFGAQCRHSCVVARIAHDAEIGMKTSTAYACSEETYESNMYWRQGCCHIGFALQWLLTL